MLMPILRDGYIKLERRKQNMKLIDIANRIDKSQKNESQVDTMEFSSELNYEFDYVNQDRLKAYWIGNWYCTDSYVGYRMYFLDEEPVAVSMQTGRKSNETFEWFSKELALKVRNYLISLMPDENELNIKLCDINRDIGDSYQISFNDQILNPERAIYNGEPIEILEQIKDKNNWGIGTELRIKLLSGEEKVVDIKEIDFKFNLV